MLILKGNEFIVNKLYTIQDLTLASTKLPEWTQMFQT